MPNPNTIPPDGQQRPEPLVPTHVDLRGLPYMPLYGKQLLESDFYAIATADELRAGITLWINSWYQHPGASLPNDDRVLCALAGLGRARKAWDKVKDVALYGYIECSDGRLYHRFNSSNALTAWELRETYRARGKKGGKVKTSNDAGSSATSTAKAQPEPKLSPAQPENGREEKRRESALSSRLTEERGDPLMTEVYGS